MFSKAVAALGACVFLIPAAEAAVSVDFTVGTQQTKSCAAAENVRLTPATTVAGMRFSYLCNDDGVELTCQPAVASTDPDIQPGGPNVKYTATGGGAAIAVVCDDGPAAAPVSVKGTEVLGIAGPTPLVGCHPATAISFQTSLAVEECVAGSGAGTAACLKYRCPNDTATRACFPVANVAYTARLPESESALRRVNVQCELRPPMLNDNFDEG